MFIILMPRKGGISPVVYTSTLLQLMLLLSVARLGKTLCTHNLHPATLGGLLNNQPKFWLIQQQGTNLAFKPTCPVPPPTIFPIEAVAPRQRAGRQQMLSGRRGEQDAFESFLSRLQSGAENTLGPLIGLFDVFVWFLRGLNWQVTLFTSCISSGDLGKYLLGFFPGALILLELVVFFTVVPLEGIPILGLVDELFDIKFTFGGPEALLTKLIFLSGAAAAAYTAAFGTSFTNMFFKGKGAAGSNNE